MKNILMISILILIGFLNQGANAEDCDSYTWESDRLTEDTSPLEIDALYTGNTAGKTITYKGYSLFSKNNIDILSWKDQNKINVSVKRFIKRTAKDIALKYNIDPTEPFTIEFLIPSCVSKHEVHSSLNSGLTGEGGNTLVGYKYLPCIGSACCKLTLTAKLIYDKIYIIDVLSSSTDNCDEVQIPSTDPTGGTPGIYWYIQDEEDASCKIQCGDLLKMEKDTNVPIDVDLGPCSDSFNDGSDCTDPVVTEIEFEREYPYNGNIIQLIYKAVKIECMYAPTKFFIKEIELVNGDWTNISSKELTTDMLNILSKFYVREGDDIKVDFSIPCMTISANTTEVCTPIICCKLNAIIDVLPKNKVTIRSLLFDSESGCTMSTAPENIPDVFSQNGEEVLPDLAFGECGLECYWHTDGNEEHELPEDHFIGPTNGDSFIIKTGNDQTNPSNLAERVVVTNDGKVGIGTGSITNYVHSKMLEVAENVSIGENLKIGGFGSATALGDWTRGLLDVQGTHFHKRIILGEEYDNSSMNFEMFTNNGTLPTPETGLFTHKLQLKNLDGSLEFKLGRTEDVNPDEQRFSTAPIIYTTPMTFTQDGLVNINNLKVLDRVYFNSSLKFSYEDNSTSPSSIIDMMEISQSGLKFMGKIYSNELIIDEIGSFWPDYVFSEDYKLSSLTEVEKYIQENGHLPDVPSAKDVENDGLKVAEMQSIMMRKIEELTLHMIELQKQNQKLKEELILLKK